MSTFYELVRQKPILDIFITVLDYRDWQKLLSLSKTIREKIGPHAKTSKIEGSWKLAEKFTNRNLAKFKVPTSVVSFSAYGFLKDQTDRIIGCCVGWCGCRFLSKFNVIGGTIHGPLTSVDHNDFLDEHSHYNKGIRVLHYEVVYVEKTDTATLIYQTPLQTKKRLIRPINIGGEFESHKNWSTHECPICRKLAALFEGA